MVNSSDLITAAIAVVLVVIAWKVLKGIVKTAALIGILVLAAIVIFGGMG